MAPLAYAMRALPLRGLIGAVLGISNAIGDLGPRFNGQERDEAIVSVLASLQFAFDADLAGLVLVIPVMALARALSLVSDPLAMPLWSRHSTAPVDVP